MYSKPTPLWKVFFFMLLGIFACMALFLFAIDEVCRTNIATRQPLYPDAEVVSSTHSLLRPRAMGITRMTLSTPDEEESVRQWFRDLTLDLLRRGEFRGIASVEYRVRSASEGAGTLIDLYSECGEL